MEELVVPNDGGPSAQASPFMNMAVRIDQNIKSFAGSAVIVPPSGDPIEVLILNPSPNPAMFWSSIKTLIEMEIEKLADRERNQNAWGR
jgi:hypothetical protein